MPSTKEIKDRIESVRQTQKITSAMYLISSTKLRRAREDLEHTRPYFDALRAEIKRIFRTSSDIHSRYFYPPHEDDIKGGLLDGFNRGAWKKLYIVYTDMESSLASAAKSTRLLPFHRAHFASADEDHSSDRFEFMPDMVTVLNNMVESYVSGFIYSALIDSFCSEQNARMTAMDAANENAQRLLDELSLQYNRVRPRCRPAPRRSAISGRPPLLHERMCDPFEYR